MSILLGILLAFFVFFVIVLIHEFGHFFTARKTGMKVEEFGIGIPPKVKTLFEDKKGTQYTFNLFPMGGFVKIFGEDPTDLNAKKSGAFMSKPWASRALVLVAGVVMNFVLAWFLFFGLFLAGSAPISVNPLAKGETSSYFLPSFDEAIERGFLTFSGVKLEPLSGSIAERSGIKKDDVILRANTKAVKTPEDLINIIQAAPLLDLTLMRDGKPLSVSLNPQDGKIGAYVGYNDIQLQKEKTSDFSFGESLFLASREVYAMSMMTLKAFDVMIEGIFFPKTPQEHETAKSMLSGPIGVGATFVDVVTFGASWMLVAFLVAILSVNLGVLNILPLPALDGGRLVTTTLYSLVVRFFGKSERTFLTLEKYFHALGFFLLLFLMLYVAGLDISRLFS